MRALKQTGVVARCIVKRPAHFIIFITKRQNSCAVQFFVEKKTQYYFSLNALFATTIQPHHVRRSMNETIVDESDQVLLQNTICFSAGVPVCDARLPLFSWMFCT